VDFKAWNSRLFDEFFRPEKAGQRVYLSVTEDSLGGPNAVLDLIEATKAFGCGSGSQKLCSSARNLVAAWVAGGKVAPPPFLPYLALFVLAAGRQSPQGHPGFHKKLHELLGEEAQNTPVTGFYNMWELWEHLADWSKYEAGGRLGNFFFNFERTHVSIPLSQIVISPSERAKLPGLFAIADLDPNNPPSDQELADIVYKYGTKCALHPRTLKSLSGSSDEFRVLLVETLLDELQDWQPYNEHIASDAEPAHGHILINLQIDRVAGTAQPLFRVFNDGRFPEGELKLVNSGQQYSLRLPPIGWSSEIQSETGDTWPRFNWAEKSIFQSSTGLTFTLTPSNFRIFEKGHRRGLDFYLETRRFNAAGSFVLATNDKTLDLEEWGQGSCSGWGEISVSGLPKGWRLFSADAARTVAAIAKKYPAFAPPLACRIRLVGGLKIGRSSAYLDGYPPRVEVEAPNADHTVELNGKEVARCRGLTTLILDPASLVENNKVAIYPTLSPDDGGRSQKFSLKKPEQPSLPAGASAIPYSSMKAEVQGGQVKSAEVIPAYPLQEDFSDRRSLVIGQKIGQLADSSAWSDLQWNPVWLLEKGRKRLRLQFCGADPAACEPSGFPGRKALQEWKRELYARRKEISPPGNKTLAQLWKRYLEACNP
jgi:hypothetical protein